MVSGDMFPGGWGLLLTAVILISIGVAGSLFVGYVSTPAAETPESPRQPAPATAPSTLAEGSGGQVGAPSAANREPESRFCAAELHRVIDGDGIEVLWLEPPCVRFATILRIGAGLDAPELGDKPELDQPWGREARGALHGLLAGEVFELEVRPEHSYGRPIVRIRIGGLDVAERLIWLGLGWHEPRFSGDRAERYAEAEAEARAARRGLWSDPKPIAPWEWRGGVR